MYILQVRLGARYGGKLHLYLVILDTRANGNPLIAIAALPLERFLQKTTRCSTLHHAATHRRTLHALPHTATH